MQIKGSIISLPDNPGQMKLPMGQVNFGKVFWIIYNLFQEKCKILDVGQIKIFGYVEPWNLEKGSASVQIMAQHWQGDKSLPEPMLTYCQLNPQEIFFFYFLGESNFKYS